MRKNPYVDYPVSAEDVVRFKAWFATTDFKKSSARIIQNKKRETCIRVTNPAITIAALKANGGVS